MPGNLDIGRLSKSIADNILAINAPAEINGVIFPFSHYITDYTVLNNFCSAIAQAVITEIKNNALLTITVSNHIHTTPSGLSGPPVPGTEAVETGDPTAVPPTGGIA